MAYDKQLILRLGDGVPEPEAKALAGKGGRQGIPICTVDTQSSPSGGRITLWRDLDDRLRVLTGESRLFIMGHGCVYKRAGFCVGDLSGAKLADELVRYGLTGVKKISVVSCEAANHSWPEDLLKGLVEHSSAFRSTRVSARTMVVGIVTEEAGEDAGTHFGLMGGGRKNVHHIGRGSKKLHRGQDIFLVGGDTAVAADTSLHHGSKQKKEYAWDGAKGKVTWSWVEYEVGS